MIVENLKGFLAHPFDPNNDGQTSLIEWFAFVGLMIVIVRIWATILDFMLE